MFQSQAMRKVELFVPDQDVVAVTEILATSGFFHLTPTEHLGEGALLNTDSQWHNWATTFATLERRILSVMEALEVEQGPPPEAPHLIEPSVAQHEIEHLEKEIQAPLHELETARRKVTQLKRYLTQLEPIADLDIDLGNLRNMRYTYAMLGMIPATNIERLRSSLEHIPHKLIPLRQDAHLTAVLLFGLQRDAQILDRAARSAYLNPLKPPETYRGTPEQAIAALHAGITRAQHHIAEDQVELEHLHEFYIRRLQHLLWRVRASRKLVETITQYERLRYNYLIAGWVPATKIAELSHHLEVVSENITIEIHLPKCESDTAKENGTAKSEEEIPVVLENPFILRAFQGLVTNYGYPRYGELNPVSVVALTFPLTFGIMFGDVGHGALLTLLGIVLSSGKVRAFRDFASMGIVVIACGIAAILFGFLYGSIFGFEEVLRPLWLQPLDNIMDTLIATVGIGTMILSLGMIYNVINAIAAKQWGRMLFHHNGLAGLAFYWSLLGLAAELFMPNMPVNRHILTITTLVSGIAVTFATVLGRLVEKRHPLVEQAWSTYLMEAFFELFETVIGFLSNTLSYVRMGAFAVAHGALSLVVFIIADIVSPTRGLGYWIVVALGNLFVIGFEGMIVGIQTLRLEYYEFFSKFFSGGGLRYNPLSLISKEKSPD